MEDYGDRRDKKASIIAAAITFVAALVILVLLFVLSVGDDRRMMAEVSTPEMQDDEEIFLEPELLVVAEPGSKEEDMIEEAAPQPPGEPDPGEEEQPERVVKNEIPPVEEPVSNKPKLVSTDKPNDVKTSTPKLTPEEEKRLASISGNIKTDNNGSRTGQETGVAGTGGVGVAFNGSLKGDKGRVMISCPTSKVQLTQKKVVIKVDITVNAQGKVTKATAISGGTPELRSQCERWAKGSSWTPKTGAQPEPGTITFTLTLK